MNSRLLFAALGMSLAANTLTAQVANQFPFSIPEGYKVLSVNVSGNGQTALVAVKGSDEAVKYLSYTKTDGSFGDGSEDNPLNSIIKDNGVTPMNPSLSVDGSSVYYSVSEDGNSDIYFITRENGRWSSPVSAGSEVNTFANEDYPSISPDGKTLFFTRLNDGAADRRCGTLYMSEFENGKFSVTSDVPEPVSLGCEMSPYVGPDSKTIYFASIREEGNGAFDIYYTQRLDAKTWLVPVPVDSVNNSSDEFSPAWDYSAKSLYYISQDPKKKGNYSILSVNSPSKQPLPVTRYYGKVLDKATGKPVGADITVTDVFSSQVLNRYRSDAVTGDYDFFVNNTYEQFLDFSMKNYSHAIEQVSPNGKENKKDYSIFSKIKMQLNVFDSDMFEALPSDITILSDGASSGITPKEVSKGRYTMELPIGHKYGFSVYKNLYDDYKFDLDLSQVVIFDSFERDAELKSNKAPVKFVVKGLAAGTSAEINIVDLSTATKYATSVTTDADGNGEIMLRKGDDYSISIMKKGYTMYNSQMTVAMDCPASGYTVTAELTRLEQDVRIEIPNVNFETGSSVLDASSYETLNKVVTLLKMNPDIRIELSAHTDDTGSDAFNNKLSDQRAASVASYITNKGVDKKNIVSKGYGKAQPLVPNTSDENRAKNRRVEIKILGTVNNQ